jgi:hypothetical protein
MSLLAKGMCNLAANSSAVATELTGEGPNKAKGSYCLGIDETKCLYTFFVTNLDADS